MPRKPKALLEGWQLLELHGRPFQIWGHVTGHPKLPGFRRFIYTSRVLKLSADRSRAETCNTIYELRHPVADVTFEGAAPVRLLIENLMAERVREGNWRIRRDGAIVAAELPGMSEAVLSMLALLDRDPSRKRAR